MQRRNEAVLATPITPTLRYTTRFAFQHVTNHNGTSDSICLRCHAIVASSHNEYSLEQAERTHMCTVAGSAHLSEAVLIWD